MKLALILFSVALSANALGGPLERPFYAFENGVRFGSVAEKAAALQKLGYDGVGSARLPKDGDIDGMLKVYREHDLKVFSFYVGGDRNLLMESIPKLKGSGVALELYVQGRKPDTSEDEIVTFVRTVADLAKEAGIEVVLYPHTGFYIETIGDAVRVAELCERPNVGVMFNLCHFLKVEPASDLKAALEKAKPFLRQVSVSGATVGGKSWGQLIQPLGAGNYDQAGLLKILDSIEFSGPVGLQCYNIKGEPMDFLKKSITSWNLLSEAK